MKKILKYLKQNIIGFVVGGIVFGSFGVCAAVVISASNIGYSDTNDLGATNVQAAIDGTCSKVDTRLSNIEKKKQDILTTTTGTVSVNFETLSNYGCEKAYKYGNIVMYNCMFIPESEIPTNTHILTFPNGYRPISQTNIVISISGTGYLSTGGNLSLANDKLKANVWYQFSVTFISS